MTRWIQATIWAGMLCATGCYEGVGDAANGNDGGADGLTDGAGDDDGGGDGDGDGADDGDDGGSAPEGYEPAAVSLRLLLSHQYRASIRDLLSDAAADAATPPADIALNGFTSIGAAQLALGDSAIDAYEDSARAVAAAAVAGPGTVATLTGCTPTGPSDAVCTQQFVETFGRRAFRRPLDPSEIAQWTAVATTAAADNDSFEWGIRAVISGMLQSPFFIYQVEIGEADPADKSVRRLTGYEMATRLSFFLMGTTPDDALLDAAAAGDLDDAEGTRQTAVDLLSRPAAGEALQTFVGELYRLPKLAELPKDSALFPDYSSELAEAMRQETLHFVAHVWEQGGDFREFFDADYTFVNDRMAAHYGIEGDFGEEFVRVALPAEQRRGGILGQAGVLSLLAHVTSTSPTLRGKFIRENVLCQTIPPPPPDVVTDVPPSGGNTLRERLEIHMSEPSCAACHALMDPLGFGLESYDATGRYRTLDNGFEIDDSADIDGMPFSGARELGTLLGELPGATTCLLRNLYRHGSGHVETADEFAELKVVSEAFAEDGYQLRTALADMVASPAFRFVGEAQ